MNTELDVRTFENAAELQGSLMPASGRKLPGGNGEWHTQVPLIVIGRGAPFERKARDGSNSQTNRMTEEQFADVLR